MPACISPSLSFTGREPWSDTWLAQTLRGEEGLTKRPRSRRAAERGRAVSGDEQKHKRRSNRDIRRANDNEKTVVGRMEEEGPFSGAPRELCFA